MTEGSESPEFEPEVGPAPLQWPDALPVGRLPLGRELSCAILCPRCREDWIHLEGVSVGQEISVVEVTQEGVRTVPFTNPGRGSQVRVLCWCEGGHRFVLVLEFYKGGVYLYSESRPDVDPAEASLPELWRS